MKLTPREQDIAALLVLGRSNKEIGKQIGMSPSTVRMHLIDMYRKLGVRNRTQAAVEIVTA